MPLDPTMIDAFKKSTQEVFVTMLQQASVAFDDAASEAGPCGAICGIITFTGGVTGRMTLDLPIEAATSLIEKFMGCRIEPNNPDFADAVGEVANMVAGAAKSKFGVANVTISPPSVVIGNDYRVMAGRDDTNAVLNGRFDQGQFRLTLSLKPGTKLAA